MEGTIFKIILGPFRESSWGGLLFKQHKLFALILPLNSKKAVLKKIRDLAKGEVVFSTKKHIACQRAVQDYFYGKKLHWYPQLDLSGFTDFQCKVLSAVQKIPRGTKWSYTKLARMIKSPGAVRAVGTVLAKNRLPLVIPCHRVIKKDGGLGKFSGGFGKKLKILMLKLEAG